MALERSSSCCWPAPSFTSVAETPASDRLICAATSDSEAPASTVSDTCCRGAPGSSREPMLNSSVPPPKRVVLSTLALAASCAVASCCTCTLKAVAAAAPPAVTATASDSDEVAVLAFQVDAEVSLAAASLRLVSCDLICANAEILVVRVDALACSEFRGRFSSAISCVTIFSTSMPLPMPADEMFAMPISLCVDQRAILPSKAKGKCAKSGVRPRRYAALLRHRGPAAAGKPGDCSVPCRLETINRAAVPARPGAAGWPAPPWRCRPVAAPGRARGWQFPWRSRRP